MDPSGNHIFVGNIGISIRGIIALLAAQLGTYPSPSHKAPRQSMTNGSKTTTSGGSIGSKAQSNANFSLIFPMASIWPLLIGGAMCSGFTLGSSARASYGWQADFMAQSKNNTPPQRGPPEDWHGKVPMVVSNNCDHMIWPAFATQHGIGPGTGGFELATGGSKKLWVSPDWQGRVWGRTNCTVNGDSCKCKTGDCSGQLDCEFSVSLMGVSGVFLQQTLANESNSGANAGDTGRVQPCGRSE